MIALGSDHVGYELKKEIMEYLDEKGIAYKDFGHYDSERADYPMYGEAVARAVASSEFEKGLIFCGTGVGISIAANKVNGIRAVVCSDCYTAKLSRLHNDSNILSLGARVVGTDLAKMIVEIWLETPYEGGRHQKRLDLISEIEKKECN